MSGKRACVILYGYWSSSATWRVRAALMYKGINYEEIPVDIVSKDVHYQDYTRKINPMGFVPAVKMPKYAGERVFCESLPILELIEDAFPTHQSLLPKDPIDKHRVRHICEIINAGMQPVQNLSILRELDLTNEKQAEYLNFTQLRGVSTLESLIDDGPFCVGQTMTMADMFFVPQLRNIVDRHKINIDDYPKCRRLYDKLKEEDIFTATHPIATKSGDGV